MTTTTIVIHLPAHRQRALQLQGASAESESAYDACIAAYLQYLQQEGESQGFALTTDMRSDGPVFSIDEADHASKKRAHDWLETMPDIWNWMP